jgi:hypothetical protein
MRVGAGWPVPWIGFRISRSVVCARNKARDLYAGRRNGRHTTLSKQRRGALTMIVVERCRGYRKGRTSRRRMLSFPTVLHSLETCSIVASTDSVGLEGHTRHTFVRNKRSNLVDKLVPN